MVVLQYTQVSSWQVWTFYYDNISMYVFISNLIKRNSSFITSGGSTREGGEEAPSSRPPTSMPFKAPL